MMHLRFVSELVMPMRPSNVSEPMRTIQSSHVSESPLGIHPETNNEPLLRTLTLNLSESIGCDTIMWNNRVIVLNTSPPANRVITVNAPLTENRVICCQTPMRDERASTRYAPQILQASLSI